MEGWREGHVKYKGSDVQIKTSEETSGSIYWSIYY